MTVTNERLREIGLTTRQVEHWTSQGYLRAAEIHPGSGRARSWADGEDHVARRMLRLVAAGVLPAAAERVARGGKLGDGIEVYLDGSPVSVYPGGRIEDWRLQ